MDQIIVKMYNEELWRQFYPMTEMIITNKGRCLFPKLEYNITGLNPTSNYAFQLRIERVENVSFKFEKSGATWFRGNTNISNRNSWKNETRITKGIFKGENYDQTIFCFDRLKVTNNKNCKEENSIILQSMNKYVPVLTIIEINSEDLFQNSVLLSSFKVSPQKLPQKEYRFDFTQFYAVTSYQNREVARLKVLHNKYAKKLCGDDRKRAKLIESNNNENEELENQNPSKLSTKQHLSSQSKMENERNFEINEMLLQNPEENIDLNNYYNYFHQYSSYSSFTNFTNPQNYYNFNFMSPTLTEASVDCEANTFSTSSPNSSYTLL